MESGEDVVSGPSVDCTGFMPRAGHVGSVGSWPSAVKRVHCDLGFQHANRASRLEHVNRAARLEHVNRVPHPNRRAQPQPLAQRAHEGEVDLARAADEGRDEREGDGWGVVGVEGGVVGG